MSQPDPHAPPANITAAPPPWATKCDIYWLIFRTRAGSLPADAYSPLEAASPLFSDPTRAGTFKGETGFVIIIRYTETPVGSYNEMIYMPGNFEVPRQGAKNAARVTRIYVDQKDTTYNGEPLIMGSFFPRTPTSPTRTVEREPSQTRRPFLLLHAL
jgi:hypothetical protein